jgi:Cof subfamily protein (haloacid dehalogenase superfamily)
MFFTSSRGNSFHRGVRVIPKLVATDLDGTLVRSDGTISDRTVAALRAVERAGATVVFVTGRPTRWIADVAAVTAHTGLAICANGAIVYDLLAERVIEAFPLAVSVARAVVERLRAALPEIVFAVETLDGFAHEPAYLPRWPVGPHARVGPADELLDRIAADRMVKLLARHEELDPDTLLAQAREIVGEAVELTHSSSGGLLEISAAGVSKATTLAVVCAERDITADDVVAFGDMPNDLPMLAWAGTAYAMANSHRDVLAAVRQRAPSNDDDGVADVLERLFRL